MPSNIYETLHNFVYKCHEFSFNYHGKRYNVLGGLIGSGSAERDCLWAEVLEVDGQKQNKPWLHVFYVEEIERPISEGPLRATSSVDYTSVVRSNPSVSAVGPIRLHTLLQRPQSEKSEQSAETTARKALKDLFKS